jgi:hypothetical protein
MDCSYRGAGPSTAYAEELRIIRSFFASQKKKDVSNEANSRLNTQIQHNKSLVVHANNSNLLVVTIVTLVVVYSLLLFNVSVVIDT